jgi:hypothetical protein
MISSAKQKLHAKFGDIREKHQETHKKSPLKEKTEYSKNSVKTPFNPPPANRPPHPVFSLNTTNR